MNARFPAYLLYDAEGQMRPVEAVEAALGRLSGSPGALSRLAELAFLLDPEGPTARFVLKDAPAYLRSVHPTTYREIDERHGSARGHIDWPRTFDLRLRTRDKSWFVGSTRRRTFELPELILMRWLLERVLRISTDLGPGDLGPRDGWVGRLSALHREAAIALSHAALRDLPLRRLDAHERARCAQHASATIRLAVQVLDWHDTLLPTPAAEALARSVSRFSLVPLSIDRRFELFTLLSVMECVDRLLPTAKRTDALINPKRRAAVTWIHGDERVWLYFDQGVQRGAHADVMKHYFGVTTGVRPDIRLVRRTAGRKTTLYLDAKHSDRKSYLAASHLKMHGYIADHPRAFALSGAKVIIVCPVPVLGAPRDADPVVFVGAEGCGADGALERLLSAFVLG